MEAKLSQRVKDVLIYSREEAHRLGNNYIGLEHFLLGMIREGEGLGIRILRNLGLDLPDLRKRIEQSISTNTDKTFSADQIPLNKQAERSLKITYLEAKVFNSEKIGTEHLLLAILKDENNLVTKTFSGYGIHYETVSDELKSILSNVSEDIRFDPQAILPKDEDEDEPDESSKGFSSTSKRPVESKSKTPVLDNFGRDITRAAEENRLDPIVGREKELERISQILSRRKKK